MLTPSQLKGHFWTVAGNVRERVRPIVAPPSTPWSAYAEDPALGAVKLTGEYTEVPGATAIVVAIHGLGGCSDAVYVKAFARRAHARGYSVLRLNLRGADRLGQDVYHAGLTDDLMAALSSPQVRRHEKKYVVGFSMGGHVALRAAAAHPSAFDALVAVCSPLNLRAGCEYIDHPLRIVYRNHVLSGLREIYNAVPESRRPAPSVDASRIKTVRDWDESIVAPRFGFANADAYYTAMSASEVLPDISTPTLFVGGESDPMVPAHILKPELSRSSKAVTEVWVPGGHVGFNPRLQVWARVLHWLDSAP